jgi:predicted anti-sigma-YlaC factor YlaD
MSDGARSHDVTCEECRDAISARLDGEDPGVAADAVDRHLTTCRTCHRFAARVQALGEMVPVPQEPAPDRSAAILAAIGVRRSHRPLVPERIARAGLAMVGVVQLVAAVVGIGLGTVPHTLRDLGAFEIALAIGFLVAALRPSTAPGLLPTAAALALCLLTIVALDIVGGETAVAREGTHVTEFIGVALVWMLARGRSATYRVAT